MEEEILERYKTPEAKKGAMEALMSLKENSGWRLISDFLTMNIASLDQVLIDPPETMKEGEIKEIRRKRKLQNGFLNLPDNLIAGLQIQPTKNEVESGDPYD